MSADKLIFDVAVMGVALLDREWKIVGPAEVDIIHSSANVCACLCLVSVRIAHRHKAQARREQLAPSHPRPAPHAFVLP